ncbi:MULTISPECIES: SDR family NAD(P)-dependent oxidoreductase [unclassified Paraburkholderia]|uniref:SDR family NAD(P)-dependent oxidoreductase n=1 Tax=unclassified Paraburkholderia TaxID=2615204 RepID=UPI00160B5B8F|nr:MULTISPECIES: SDR family NAD(P)-dependent oxidoreductase [unclassified Paraburkholderia]MBB5447771.1 NAD(P)-dependent dehydrogenase (short-subunit alcohol dehydrogenase family) [Paraburkholderia sp. WSM4177]MBB5488292.1 NAD(P)-dependent dehydrogenase (short-subunit alcohol dehydrogenase family) [Paraburkholderia sp. WSM4180]
MQIPTALVVGVGAEHGLGAALCRKFSSQGYHVFVAGRAVEKIERVAEGIRLRGGRAQAVLTDATEESSVIGLFEAAFSEHGNLQKPDLVVFNAGNNRKTSLLDMTAEVFEEFWRGGCYAGFLVGREAARRMLPFGRGTIIFTGASASLRGKPGFAHFAASKAGLRMISQSMAREFGPKGLHVAHVVIDGGINGERLQAGAPARFEAAGPDGLLGIDAIADTYWHIHRQDHTAWTQEVDLRPYREDF